MEAIEKALPDFMKHPILHYQHSERPVGIVNKAYIKNGSFMIEASIFETGDTDDVWAEIEKGELNKFSIFGKRLKASSECKLQPHQRNSPCVTKAIALWSISVVGDNAINEKTFLEVVKSFLLEKPDMLIKGEEEKQTHMNCPKVSDRPEDSLTVEKCGVCEKGEEDDSEKDEEKKEVEKGEIDDPDLVKSGEDSLAVHEGNTSSILKRLDKIETVMHEMVAKDNEVHASMEKAEVPITEEGDVTKANETDTTVKKEEVIVKSEPVVDVITKAKVDEITKAAMADIQKAFDIKFAMLEEKIANMEKETIRKGGNMIVINEALIKKAESNPRIANLQALTE